MTRPSRAARVGDVLPGVLSELKLDESLRAYAAVERWPHVVGERIASHVRATAIDGGVLRLEAESSVWLQEIQFQKRRILDLLARDVGAGRVRDLKCVLFSGPGKG